MVHVSDTTILVASPIASSIHITSCQHCTIQAHAQQLRIHDSQMLKLEIDLVAGAILEGSHDILFQRPVEVKDFDWLRAGVPSPNFRIEDTVNLDKELSTIPALAVTTPTPSTIPIETKTFMAPLVEALPSKECTIDEQDDDDDDDEL